jgi:protein TonB
MMGGDNSREVLRWLVCGVLVVGVHGGAAFALTHWKEPASAGAPEAAIMLDLSTETAAPPVEQSDVAPDQTIQQQAEKEPEPEEKPVEKEPDPPPKEPPPQKAEVALPPPPKPKPKPVEKKKVASVNTRPISAEKQSDHAVTASPGALGRAKAEWSSLIVAHLNRNKNYPSGARSRHEEGTVLLSFTLDRNGHLVSGRVVRGSGFAELDAEALAMLHRAQPFPRPSAEVSGSTFPFTAPMRYYLR